MKWFVTTRGVTMRGRAVRGVSRGVLIVLLAVPAVAQTNSNERTFPQSKAVIEKALAAVQATFAGHLPVLEGFAKPAAHPLDRYQRGYYQATVKISSTASGGSLVHVSTKVTAWFTDPVASRSGYELLTSNGRIEGDLLDQLAEQLAKSTTESSTETGDRAAAIPAPKPSSKALTQGPATEQPAVSAPSPKFPASDQTFSSSARKGLADQARESAKPPDAKSENSNSALQAEADGLEEVLKNTAHPNNLVAVKKFGTPVVATPSLTAKPQFLASMHDEFEMLDFNANWVHVRISGLSRGWIWRDSVEMPDGIADTDVHPAAAIVPAADRFHVVREETSTFPGDWQPLRGKSVKIVSIEKADEKAQDGGPQDKLEYAKYLLDKNFAELSQKQADLAGIVLIFDSVDGGMIAVTSATLKQWKSGVLTDPALWHNCFFDPPETFVPSPSSGTQ